MNPNPPTIYAHHDLPIYFYLILNRSLVHIHAGAQVPPLFILSCFSSATHPFISFSPHQILHWSEGLSINCTQSQIMSMLWIFDSQSGCMELSLSAGWMIPSLRMREVPGLWPILIYHRLWWSITNPLYA